MATDKPHIKTQLRRELLRALSLTTDPDLMAKLGMQLADLLGTNKATKAAHSKPGKGTKQAENPATPTDGGLLGG